MKKIIFTLLFSSMAMANWYELNNLNCRFTNATTLKYSLANPQVATGVCDLTLKDWSGY